MANGLAAIAALNQQQARPVPSLPQTSTLFKRRRDELNNNNEVAVVKKPKMSLPSKRSSASKQARLHAKCNQASFVDELHTSPVSGTIIRDSVTSLEGDVVPIHKGETTLHLQSVNLHPSPAFKCCDILTYCLLRHFPKSVTIIR